MKRRIVLIVIASILIAAMLYACDASARESQQTWANRQSIAENIPVPSITFSARRWVLANYYNQVLDRPRLRTCTLITSRGATQGYDVLAVAETIGMPVNLSNQVTDPEQSEPDSVYPGPSDQTVLVLRNGLAVVSEADTTAITGDCPPGLKPNTIMQQVLDYQMAQPGGDVNFLPPDKPAGP